jgi:toxin-antitoxin system PIN domain toxin
VKLVDTNVLLSGVNRAAPRHEESRRWLEAALSGNAPVGLAWLVLLGFLRISTRRGAFAEPLSVHQAVALMHEWLQRPAAHLLHPTRRHADLLGRLLEDVGVGGDLTTDAHLAALAREHHATVVTYDSDFARFPGVRWERPDAGEDR